MKLINVMYKISFPTSHWTLYFSIKKTERRVLCGEIIAVYIRIMWNTYVNVLTNYKYFHCWTQLWIVAH